MLPQALRNAGRLLAVSACVPVPYRPVATLGQNCRGALSAFRTRANTGRHDVEAACAGRRFRIRIAGAVILAVLALEIPF
jgi:hypothetical protein